MNKTILSLALLVLGLHLCLAVLRPDQTDALAIFSRRHDVQCGMCHTAWPLLNTFGRTYKENGYRLSRDPAREESPSDVTDWERHVPLGIALASQPYDKIEGRREQVRFASAVTPLIAGRIYGDWNGYARIQAADDDSVALDLPLATLGYNYRESFNLRYAWAAVTYPDSYDTYSARRTTRGLPPVAGQAFGGADGGGSLSDPRHSLSASGRLGSDLFYTVGLSGGGGRDRELDGSWALSGRLAYEIAPDVMLGGFWMRGRCETEGACSPGLDFNRYALDTQMDFDFTDRPSLPGVLRLAGAYLTAGDDRTIGGRIENSAWYVQSLYVVHRDGRPTFVPTLRLDGFERAPGRFYQATLNLGYYLTWNVKTFLEYAQEIRVPDGQERNARITFQISAAF